MKELKAYEAIATDAVHLAGKVLTQHFNSIKNFEIKKDAGIVTKADTDSEEILSEFFNKKTPDFGILAEENGAKGNDKIKWIIDPLDGTTNFFHGFPHFNISVALEYEGVVCVGVVHNPITGDIYHCTKGSGAYKNKKPIRVSKNKDLSSSMLGTGFAYMRDEVLDQALSLFKKFTYKSHGIRRPGAAALDLCYLAEGIYDGFYEKTLSAWDVSAGALLIEEAGGKVSDYKGNKFSIYGKEILASNGLIHDQIIEVLNS